MTDKKMAEESLISYRKETKWAGKMFMHDENTIYKDGFLAGLKAGRPEWHKISDGDLPEEEGEYLVCYETEDGNYRNIFILNYTEYDESLHWCDEAFETYDEGVIAWCEIPTYMEE